MIVLGNIKTFPDEYLGKASITRLGGFVDGYLHGEGLCDNIDQKKIHDMLSLFREWLVQRCTINTAHGWSDLLLFLAGDERTAFYVFYELLEEFLQKRNDS